MALIVVEGLDGSGKSTQVNNLRSFFERQGMVYHYIHFPRTTDPYFGEMVARFLRGEFGNIDEVDPYLVAMLYAGDRNDAANEIRQKLSEGAFVLVDRYVCSNIAFQCAKVQDDEKAKKLKNWILGLEYERFGIPQPDINLFLDVPFEFTRNNLKRNRHGIDRAYLKGGRDIHEEDLDFQEKVRKQYLEQVDKDVDFFSIYCADQKGNMLTPDAIFDQIISLLNNEKII